MERFTSKRYWNRISKHIFIHITMKPIKTARFGVEKGDFDYLYGEYKSLEEAKRILKYEGTVGLQFTVLKDDDTVDLYLWQGVDIEPTKLNGTGSGGGSGEDGVGIEYQWRGTELGIKREDETSYTYVNLKGAQGEKGLQGDRGLQGVKGNDGYTPVKGVDYFDGKDFRYSDFTPEQLELLKGPQGERGQDGYTPIKGVDYFDGEKGDPFVYEDFTQEQLDSLKGEKGEQGDVSIVDLTPYETIENSDLKLSVKADKTELEGLASEEYVDSQMTIVQGNLNTFSQSQNVVNNNLEQRLDNLDSKEDLDEHLKMVSDGTKGYLADFLDNTTVVNEDGKLKIKSIDGLNVGSVEINHLQGVTGNIQAQINSLSNMGEFKGAKQTKAELDAVTGAVNGDMWIVLEDETDNGISVLYAYDGISWISLGEFKTEIRDFSTDPLDLTSEVTNVLPLQNLPIGSTQETVALGNHSHDVATTTKEGFMSTQDKGKIDGIEIGATKNSTDVSLRDRATHTGTQPFTTISGTATESQIPNLPASKITSGTLGVDRIPNLPTSKISSGVLNVDRLPLDSVATTSKNGFMSSVDRAIVDKLQGITPVTAESIVVGDSYNKEEVKNAFEYILTLLELAGVVDYEPTQLFENTTESLWYDFTDPSLMYQDQHAQIPVTAVGQPIGLILDKSKGLKKTLVFNLEEKTLQEGFNIVSSGNTIVGNTLTIAYSGGANAWFPETYARIAKIKAKGTTTRSFKFRNGSNERGAFTVPSGAFDVEFLSGAMFAMADSGLYINSDVLTGEDPCIIEFTEFTIEAIDSTPAFQITEIAKPKLGYNAVTKTHCVQFDGVRSCFNVGRVNLSTTNKATIISSQTKALKSPVTSGMIFELGATATVTGSLTFGINTSTGDSNQNTWFMSENASGTELIASATGYPSPDSKVMVGEWDKSASTKEEQMKLWLNNEPQELIFSKDDVLGTGNFAKIEAYIGTRGQYGDQFMFKGDIYEIMLLNRKATETELTKAYSRMRKHIGV